MEASAHYIQIVRSLYLAFARRDRTFFAQHFDPEVEWQSAENFLYADQSPYMGVDAVAHLIFDRLFGDWEDFSMEPGEVLGGGDLVIANGRFRGTFKANGATVNAQFVQVFHFKDGRIAKSEMYTDTAQFRDTVSAIRSVSV
jgi:hypothetical protein